MSYWRATCCVVLLSLGIGVDSHAGQVFQAMRLVPDPRLPELSIAWTAQQSQFLQARGVLRLGVSITGYDPLELARGQVLKGITADYISILGKSLGLAVEVRAYPDWSSTLEALQAGEVDILGRGSSYEEELPGLLLSTTYVANQPVLVGRGTDFTDPGLEGKLAAVQGYVSSQALSSRFPATQIEYFSTVREALHAVEYRKADWLVGDSITVAYYLAQGELPNLRIRQLSEWRENGYSFVFRSADSLLRDVVNRVLATVPELVNASILDRWGGQPRFDSSPVKMYSQEAETWLATRPSVVVAVSGAAPPYSFYDADGQYRGIFADLLAEISLRSGLNFHIVDRFSISGIMKSLHSGEADLTPMLSSTVERRRLLHYTDPIIQSSFALVGSREDSTKDLEGLKGRRIAVLRDTLVTEFIRKQYPGIKLVNFDTPLDALVAVIEGDAEGAVMLLPMARYLVDHYFTKELRVITSMPEVQANVSFAILKDQPLLSEVIATTISQFEPRDIGRMVERWQESSPAESSVWYAYERRWTIVLLAAGAILSFLIIWLFYAFIKKLKRRAEETRVAFRSTLLDSIPQAVVMRDAEGRFVFCNHTFYTVFGVPPDDVLGRRWGEICTLDPVLEGIQDSVYRQLLVTHAHIDVRQISVKIHGESFIFRQWAVLHKEREGKVGLLVGWVDLSETERLMRELEQVRDEAVLASSAKSRFLAVMSHEIRTPLNAVIGLLELSIARVDNGEDWDRSAIEVAYSSSLSLMHVIGDILDLAKIESGKMVMEPQRSNPVEIVELLQHAFYGQARQKNLYLETTVDHANNSDIMIDSGRLKQILSNLIGNAIKFTDQGGVKIFLRTWVAGPELTMVFLIEDSGIGIALQDHDRLFQPFSQVPGQYNVRGGSGLGLAICQQLIDVMGGVMELESTLGGGTRITVTLQAPILETAAPEKEPSVRGIKQDFSLRILLADDYSANRLLLGRQLEFLGHQVREAEDGVHALALYDAEKFDIVITDCNMPHMDGYELTNRIRDREVSGGGRRCLVLGFTANAQEEERQRCLAAGMDECLFKPVSLDTLRKVLGEFDVHTLQTELRVNYHVQTQLQVFDLNLIQTLTCGDDQVVITLFEELYKNNAVDLNQLDELLRAEEWVSLGKISHRLKGAARMVGAEDLIKSTRAYEEAINKGYSDSEMRQCALNIRHALCQLQEGIIEWKRNNQNDFQV